jgi:hypothetical protein
MGREYKKKKPEEGIRIVSVVFEREIGGGVLLSSSSLLASIQLMSSVLVFSTKILYLIWEWY